MRVFSLDSRQLAIYTIRVTDGRYYNPVTTGWETPFNPLVHLTPLVPIPVAPGQPGGGIQTADNGIVGKRTDVMLIVCTTTGAGNTLAWVDDVDWHDCAPWEFPSR